jgi:hypothetical protein
MKREMLTEKQIIMRRQMMGPAQIPPTWLGCRHLRSIASYEVRSLRRFQPIILFAQIAIT